MNNWTAIVMAAGKSVRMRSSVPKVLHPVAGVPMISHAVQAVRRLEPGALLVVVSSNNRNEVSAALGEGVELVEQPDPLGTGHALATALPRVNSQCAHVLVLGADTPLIRTETLQTLLQRHVDTGAVLSLLTTKLSSSEAPDLGRLQRNDQGWPICIVEANEAGPGPSGLIEANVGVYCIASSWLRSSVDGLVPHSGGESYVTDLVELARNAQQPVEVIALEDPWEGLGVNTRAQLARAEAEMQARLRFHWMAQGVTLRDPATTYLHASVELSEDLVILPNTSIQGTTRIGRGGTIGPNAVVVDTTIADGCTISSSMLEGAALERGVEVGPFCHLRPGTHLEEGVHVGSHVEIKNSRIGRGTKLGHFCYIGDSILGPHVNVGAGTVTCNYDGVQKHVTEIGEGALIGSGTLLVAPVKVGARAVTGAGAVITRDVDPDTTVVGVPARELVPSRDLQRKAVPRKGGNSFG